MRVCSGCKRCFDDTADSCEIHGVSQIEEARAGGTDIVPGYELEVQIESGIGGGLFRARRTDCGRSCLINIVPSGGSQERFAKQAGLASTLIHPNLTVIYETGTLESGECYVVSEDPEGESLRDFLETGGVPELLTTVQIVSQTAEALHAMHTHGLTHGAVMPENIFVTPSGEGETAVKLGLADIGGLRSGAVVSNKFLIDSAADKLRYFAPELFSGETATAQTDVYGLGVVYYELLAGVPPFDAADAAALIEMHRRQKPPEIVIDNFDLRMLLTHCLSESLQKRPEFRQTSAGLFARQMRHIEQLATHVSTPPPAFAKAGQARPAAAAVLSRQAEAPPQPEPASTAPPVIQPAFPERYGEVLLEETRGSRVSPITIVPAAEFRHEPSQDPSRAVALLPDEAAQSAPSPAVRHRSRLRSKKKRLHSFTNTHTAIDVQQAERFEQPAPMAAAAPRRVELELPEDDIPSMEAVAAELAREPLTIDAGAYDAVSDRFDETAEWPLPAPARAVPDPRAAEDRPVFVRPAPASAASGYFPTLLGAEPETTVTGRREDAGMFAAYGTAVRPLAAMPRALAAAGGLVLAAGILLFGIGTSDGEISDWNETEKETVASSEPAATAIPQQKERETAEEPTARKAAATSIQEPAKQAEKAAAATAGPVRAAADAKPQRAVKSEDRGRPDKIAEGPGMIPSTLVITLDNGKTKMKVVPERTSAKRQTKNSDQASGATRPRIVENPRP